MKKMMPENMEPNEPKNMAENIEPSEPKMPMPKKAPKKPKVKSINDLRKLASLMPKKVGGYQG